MTKEDKLYRLVHSLNANEKGFFKKNFLHKNADENVLIVKLFDIYNNCTIYHEEVINKAIKKQGFFSQESKIKSELYQAILDTLKKYNKKETAYERIASLLEDATMLENKQLYSDVKTRLAKAKKIANEHEYYDQWLHIIKRESNLFP